MTQRLGSFAFFCSYFLCCLMHSDNYRHNQELKYSCKYRIIGSDSRSLIDVLCTVYLNVSVTLNVV